MGNINNKDRLQIIKKKKKKKKKKIKNKFLIKIRKLIFFLYKTN